MTARSDPRPPRRVRDRALLARCHQRWRTCALCSRGGDRPLSLHHINRHPRDDVVGNLVMLCGSGTTGCHGLIEARDPDAKRRLSAILHRRPDVVEYLASRGRSWLLDDL